MYNNEKLNKLNKLITNEVEEIEKISQHYVNNEARTHSKLMLATLMYVQKLMVDIDDVVVTSKVCNKCGTLKPFEEYYKRRDSVDGYYHTCKECYTENAKEYRRKKNVVVGKPTRKEIKQLEEYLEEKNTTEVKKCSMCGKILKVNSNNFYKNSKTKDGFRGNCIKCFKERYNNNRNIENSNAEKTKKHLQEKDK